MKSHFLLSLLVPPALSAVTITKTSAPPTGYDVTFTYRNASASNVTLGGNMALFTDQYRTTYTYAARFDPHDWKPGDFPGNHLGIQMEAAEPGVFTYTGPFPSGTYGYAFIPDAPANASLLSSAFSVVDPDNPPFETVPGTETVSTFQVPYHGTFQHYDELYLNFDYALPIDDAAAQGSVHVATYPSPGAVSPAPDVHDFAIYLPAGYAAGAAANKKYPLLYLSHGGGGAAGDWQNQARVGNMLDRLIADGELEPTVVVMPTFNGLLNVSDPPSYVVRPLYEAHLFPHVQAHYAVATEPARRGFAGLSLGSALTYEFYINATSYFGYFGIMSGALLPGHALADYVNATQAAAHPALLDRGLGVGYGQFDIAFDDTKLLQEALDAIGVKYATRFVPWGFHAWNTWQDLFWHFARNVLWKLRPFTDEIGHGA